jgi:Phosphatidylglycerophosphate synthase
VTSSGAGERGPAGRREFRRREERRGDSRWPNLITGARLALMPVVLALAVAGERGWFAVVLGVALATDVLDGLVARWLNAYSDFGRKLDSVADYTAMLVGLAGIALLWPEMVRREWPWIATGLGVFAAGLVVGFWRLRRAPCYHTWGAKLGAVACAGSMVPLLAGWAAWPFHVAIVLQVIAGVEVVMITLMLPGHVGEMPTVWHAWRARREGTSRGEKRAVDARR